MANIDLVPRRRTMTWLWWVIAAIAVAMVLLMLIIGNRPTTRSSSLFDALEQTTSRASALLVATSVAIDV
jgi:type VI protein secretion system component VasF